MSVGLVSLIALAVAIVLGFVRKSNVGILSIGMALLIAVIYGIKTGDLMKGFSSSLFLTMTGVSYLFGILSENNTLGTLAAKVMRLAGNRRMLIYVFTYVIGFVICAVGPGAISSLAIIPVLAIPIAKAAGLNPILLCLTGQIGVHGGRMSPITPESVVVASLMGEQSLPTDTWPMAICILATEWVLLAFCFFYFKGWQFDKTSEEATAVEAPPFNKEQIISLIGLVAMIVCALVLKMNVGLTSFLIGSILILLGVGREKKAVRSIPWGVIFMVLGVGVLMHVIMLSGGITLLSDAMSAMMETHTASAIMVTLSSIMCFFASGLGVVFPTLIPTVSGIAQNISGVDAVELVAMIVIGGTVPGFSPVSTAGALTISAVSADEEYSEKFSQNKMFIDLFIVAFVAMAISAVFGYFGVYTMILG